MTMVLVPTIRGSPQTSGTPEHTLVRSRLPSEWSASRWSGVGVLPDHRWLDRRDVARRDNLRLLRRACSANGTTLQSRGGPAARALPGPDTGPHMVASASRAPDASALDRTSRPPGHCLGVRPALRRPAGLGDARAAVDRVRDDPCPRGPASWVHAWVLAITSACNASGPTAEESVDEALWSPRETALLRFVDALCAYGTADDEQWAAVAEHFDDQPLLTLGAPRPCVSSRRPRMGHRRGSSTSAALTGPCIRSRSSPSSRTRAGYAGLRDSWISQWQSASPGPPRSRPGAQASGPAGRTSPGIR